MYGGCIFFTIFGEGNGEIEISRKKIKFKNISQIKFIYSSIV